MSVKGKWGEEKKREGERRGAREEKGRKREGKGERRKRGGRGKREKGGSVLLKLHREQTRSGSGIEEYTCSSQQSPPLLLRKPLTLNPV